MPPSNLRLPTLPHLLLRFPIRALKTPFDPHPLWPQYKMSNVRCPPPRPRDPNAILRIPLAPNLLRPKCKIRNISQLRDLRSNPQTSENFRRNPSLYHRTPRNFAKFREAPQISVSPHIAKLAQVEEFCESLELISRQDCGILRDSWKRATLRISFFGHNGSGLRGAARLSLGAEEKGCRRDAVVGWVIVAAEEPKWERRTCAR